MIDKDLIITQQDLVDWIVGTLEELDKKVIKHLPKYCIDKYLESEVK